MCVVRKKMIDWQAARLHGFAILLGGLLTNLVFSMVFGSMVTTGGFRLGNSVFWIGLGGPFAFAAINGLDVGFLVAIAFFVLVGFFFVRCERTLCFLVWGLLGLFGWLLCGWAAGPIGMG